MPLHYIQPNNTTYVCVCMYVCMYVCVFVCVFMYVCMYVHTCYMYVNYVHGSHRFLCTN